MTTETEIKKKPPKKRGRPFGILGPKRRQQQLSDQFVKALGGTASLTPVIAMNIARAVALSSFAEEARRRITKYGATVADLASLVKLEDCAERAVRKLKLPVTTINTRIDLAA
jgi:hypothetical protein